MLAGSLLRFEGKRWQVLSVEGTQYRAVAWDGEERLFEEGSQDVELAAHPPTTWPFLVAPRRPKDGPVITIRRTTAGRTVELAPLVDWSPSGWLRPGGPIFFNPRLRLRQGEVLVGVHQRGYLSRLVVTRSFGTVARRKQQAAKPVQLRRTAYDRLLHNDDDFEEIG